MRGLKTPHFFYCTFSATPHYLQTIRLSMQTQQQPSVFLFSRIALALIRKRYKELLNSLYPFKAYPSFRIYSAPSILLFENGNSRVAL